jgi:hypothetical protein
MTTKYKPIKFTNLANAKSFAKACVKPHLVMLGDDNKFWVVTPADSQRLFKVGYEYAI